MRLLLDMNLSPAMADWLRALSHDVLHARELGASDMPDREIFARARADRRILVTFDLDFGDIAGAAAAGGPPTGVVILRLRSPRQSHMRERVRAALESAGAALIAGAVVLVEDARIRTRLLEKKD